MDANNNTKQKRMRAMGVLFAILLHNKKGQLTKAGLLTYEKPE